MVRFVLSWGLNQPHFHFPPGWWPKNIQYRCWWLRFAHSNSLLSGCHQSGAGVEFSNTLKSSNVPSRHPKSSAGPSACKPSPEQKWNHFAQCPGFSYDRLVRMLPIPSWQSKGWWTSFLSPKELPYPFSDVTNVLCPCRRFHAEPSQGSMGQLYPCTKTNTESAGVARKDARAVELASCVSDPGALKREKLENFRWHIWYTDIRCIW